MTKKEELIRLINSQSSNPALQAHMIGLVEKIENESFELGMKRQKDIQEGVEAILEGKKSRGEL